jgi:hypothetical protein
MICIQILFSGDNLILVKAFGCSKKSLSESDSGNCFGMQSKGFPVFRFFFDDRTIAQGQTMILLVSFPSVYGIRCGKAQSFSKGLQQLHHNVWCSSYKETPYGHISHVTCHF